MKIGLCGAQGTGKTTLSRVLAQKLKLPHIEEQARVAAKQFNITRPSLDLKNKPELALAYEIQCLLLQMQSENLYKKGFVSDRTVIDIAVYWSKWIAYQTPATINRYIYELCKHRTQTYTLVVYIPPEIPLEDDKFRSTNQDYQADMDYLIRAMLKICKPRACITVTGTVEKRVSQVFAKIGTQS